MSRHVAYATPDRRLRRTRIFKFRCSGNTGVVKPPVRRTGNRESGHKAIANFLVFVLNIGISSCLRDAKNGKKQEDISTSGGILL